MGAFSIVQQRCQSIEVIIADSTVEI